MALHITKVKPLNNNILLLTFSNGEERICDISQYLDNPFWASLKSKEIFKTAKVIGGSVEWVNGVDFCPDELYENSKSLEQCVGEDLGTYEIP